MPFMPIRSRSHAALAAAVLLSALAGPIASTATPMKPASVDPALTAAVNDPARTASFVARDKARHPVEELTFFGLKPSMSVIELWPGGGYWTEILGAYLKPHGQYTIAIQTRGDAEDDAASAKLRTRLAAQGSRLGTIHEASLGAGQYDIAPKNSADLVLTFRNLHNWMDGGYADQVLAACFRSLKPGGIFGIEEHRGRTDTPQDPKAKNGYVRQDYAIALIEKAGFKLLDSSEIDANPKDTKDWVDGVWTLPPTLSQGDKDRDRYLAIGEADNFVLRFQKPKR
jgi:predicted methyltransferase